MTPVTALWLPILLSAIACFVVSSLIHMASPWHRNDYPGVPDEDAVMNALRPFNIPPGDYMMPRPLRREDMKSAAFTEKRDKGPVMIMTVMPNGPFAMGSTMAQWFVYLLVINFIAAGVAASTLGPGAHDHAIFHHVGIASFVGFTAALWQMSIWYHRAWSTTIKATVDGLIYAAITAWIFTLLWPKM